MLNIIFYLFLLLSIPMVSFGIIPTKKFMDLCNLENQEDTAKELIEKISTIPAKKRKHWLTKFNKIYKSPLAYAVAMQNKPFVEALLYLSVEDNISYFQFTVQQGYSLLTLAVMKNNIELVKLLLNYNHPMQMDRSYNKTSALHEAAKLAHIPIYRIFLGMKKTLKNTNLIHTRDYDKKTPINYLIENKLPELAIETLILYPIDTHNIALDIEDRSYLHHAVIHEMLDLTGFLLQHGLDPKKKSFSDETALSLAKKCVNKSIEELILFYINGNFFKSHLDI